MEGPSLVILKEECAHFTGKKVRISGNAKIDLERPDKKVVKEFLSWGKHFIIRFHNFFIRIHFLMYGSYRINSEKNLLPRLTMNFENGFINFYSCSVKIMEGSPEDYYDFSVDVMNDKWSNETAYLKITGQSHSSGGDILLDQEVFAGVGNIIRNEVLFILKMHPSTLIESLSPFRVYRMILVTRWYCHKFYGWKKIYQLKKHWKVYRKNKCPDCGNILTKTKIGKYNRFTYFCNSCQPE